MQKKLTIMLDEPVYDGLHRVVGRLRISRFIESLIRPHVVAEGWASAYRQMASDEAREAEASEWVEGTLRSMTEAVSGVPMG
jgi:hypothetical protein